MPALEVVEALDVIEHIGLGLGPCAIRLARCPFRLERGEEAFHRSIVPDIARSAHGTGDAIVRQQQPERLAGILASLIRVMQQGPGLAPPPDGHEKCVGCGKRHDF